MKQQETGIRKRITIRTRFSRTVLLAMIISILAASIAGVSSIYLLRNAMEEKLAEQLEADLKNVMQEKVSTADSKLNHYEKYIDFITDYIEKMYASEEKMLSRGRIFYPPEDTRSYALTRAFVSDTITEADMGDELRFYSNLEEILEPIAKENEDLISTIYIGTASGLLISYDRYSYLSAVPEGEELIYNYYVSEWYRRGMKEDGIVYTGVYMDSQGRGLTLTIASGFRNSQGKLAGVACIDFDISALYEDLFSTGSDSDIFTFAFDHEDSIISLDSDTIDFQGYTGLDLDEMDELRADPDGIMEKGDQVYICIPIERVGWTLCARVSRDVIQKDIHAADSSILRIVILFIVVVLLITLVAVFAVNRGVVSIIQPLELLGQDIKKISEGNLDHRATVYRNDEIGDVTSGMNEMVDRLNFTLNELMSSQQHADAMSRLATLDGLTGVRNKMDFNRESKLLAEELGKGEEAFGFAMIDLNNLKLINDNFGHEKGDIAIKKICRIICEVFAHSPVFRVGGDEFVVILKGKDYQSIDSLVRAFRERTGKVEYDKSPEPWNNVSAAIGYALYDARIDSGTESVLARADKQMYSCKKQMKGK